MDSQETDFESEQDLEPLRTKTWGHAEDVDISTGEFEGEEVVCVEFTAECGHTGAEVPLVDILKHALVYHPEVVAQAYVELGREVPQGTADSDDPDSGDADEGGYGGGRYA